MARCASSAFPVCTAARVLSCRACASRSCPLGLSLSAGVSWSSFVSTSAWAWLIFGLVGFLAEGDVLPGDFVGQQRRQGGALVGGFDRGEFRFAGRADRHCFTHVVGGQAGFVERFRSACRHLLCRNQLQVGRGFPLRIRVGDRGQAEQLRFHPLSLEHQRRRRRVLGGLVKGVDQRHHRHGNEADQQEDAVATGDRERALESRSFVWGVVVLQAWLVRGRRLGGPIGDRPVVRAEPCPLAPFCAFSD